MRFAIVGNLEKPGLREAVLRLLRQLDAAGTEYVIDREILELLGKGGTPGGRGHGCALSECFDRADVVVAFGGDGTILAVAGQVGDRGTPILGVNLGKMGFLAEVAPEEMERAVGDILAARYIVEDRLVLEAETPGVPGRVFHALNDVVVDKSRSPRIIDIETYIDGAFAVTYRGDGLIISTPTGSTAYALSNGGPIVTPASAVFGITPISPHTLSGRPLVVPSSSRIRIVARSSGNEVMFSADGHVEAIANPPLEVNVRMAPHRVRLIKRPDRSYFELLRAKLFWGQDPRSRDV
jgi:NAD+ kinase